MARNDQDNGLHESGSNGTERKDKPVVVLSKTQSSTSSSSDSAGKYNKNNHSNNGDDDNDDEMFSYGKTSFNNDVDGVKKFSFRDRKMLTQYLKEYKQGAEALYHGKSLNEVQVSSTHKSFIQLEFDQDGGDYDRISTKKEQAIMIGGCNFEPLTEDLLRRPYLMLSGELSGKQRRIVHSFCVDAGVYHTTVCTDDNDGKNDKGTTSKKAVSYRAIIISVFSNGFEYCAELKQAGRSASAAAASTTEPRSSAISDVVHPPFSVLAYKPWIYQKPHTATNGTSPSNDHAGPASEVSPADENKKHVTSFYKNKIQELIDQPGECVRNGTEANNFADILDFAELDGKDLSDAQPPGSIHGQDWLLVDTPERMEQCIQELANPKPTELAFDLEAYSKSKHAQMTCLLQLATNHGKQYVIDPLAPGMWSQVTRLRPIFADPSVVKIGHGISGLDVPSLHRDFGIFIVNGFDTFEAASSLRFRGKGLAAICAKYKLRSSDAYAALKEVYQTTDWRRRPLTEPMLLYGRYDVEYLVQLRQLMMRDLTRYELWDRTAETKQEEARQVASSLAEILRMCDEDEGYGDDAATDDGGYETPMEFVASEDDDDFEDTMMEEDLEDTSDKPKQTKFGASDLRMNLNLMQVISRSQENCDDLWSTKPESHAKNSDYLALRKRCEKGELPTWTESQSQLYNSLARWRNDIAIKEELLSGLAIPIEILIVIAYKRPTSLKGLKKLSFQLPELLEDVSNGYIHEIFEMAKESLLFDGIEIVEDSQIPFYREAVKTTARSEIEAPRSKPKTDRFAWAIGSSLVAGVLAAVVVVALRGRKR